MTGRTARGSGTRLEVRTFLRSACLSLALAAAGPAGVAAPQESPAPGDPLPFRVGERAEYDVTFGALKAGKASMEVLGIENVRDRRAYRVRFLLKGGIPGYRIKDRFESWMDVETLASLRFVTDQEEGRRDREKHYEIFPDRQLYVDVGKKRERPSVAAPLDEGSFLYFMRTVRLEVGKTYSFDRYFQPDKNPVVFEVLRRERVKVPAGEYDAVVVRPIIKTKGIFSKKGRAEVWLSDDDRRVVLQMKSWLYFGSINLYLRSLEPGA